MPREVYSVAVDAVRGTNFITSSARHRCVCFDRLLLFTCVSVCIGADVDVGVGVGFVFFFLKKKKSCKYSVRICTRCLYFCLWFGAR